LQHFNTTESQAADPTPNIAHFADLFYLIEIIVQAV